MNSSKVNVLRIVGDDQQNEKLIALFEAEGLPIGKIHQYSVGFGDVFALSFKIGTATVHKLRDVLAHYMNKNTHTLIEFAMPEGGTFKTQFTNLSHEQQIELLEKAMAMALTMNSKGTDSVSTK